MEFCITRGTIVWLLPYKIKKMKKMFFWVAISSLSFMSCSSSNEETRQEPEQARVETQEVKKTKKIKENYKSGIVHRIYVSQFRTTNTFYVRLKDGKVLEGKVGLGIGGGMDQPEDFYFVEPGDVIFYDGDDVISVKFKD